MLKGSLSDTADAEVEEELENMLKESAAAAAAAVDVELPSVPTNELPVADKKDKVEVKTAAKEKQKQLVEA